MYLSETSVEYSTRPDSETLVSTQPYLKEIGFEEFSIRDNSEFLLSTLPYIKEINRVEYSTKSKLSVNFNLFLPNLYESNEL